MAPVCSLLSGVAFAVVIHTSAIFCYSNEPAGAPQLFAPSNAARSINSTVAPAASQSNSAVDQEAGSLRFSQSRWDTGKSNPQRTPKPAAGLKWGSPTETGAANSQAAHPASADTWRNRNSRIPASVRMVGHEKAADPFDDPFGDRAPQADQAKPVMPVLMAASQDRDSGFQPQATQPPSRTVTEQPSFDALPSTPAASGTLQRPADSTREDAAPAPPIGQSDLGQYGNSAEVLPTPREDNSDYLPTLPDDDEKPCDRVYNERNCCAEDEKCQTAQQALYNNSITKISLDITASFKPEAETNEEELEERAKQLQKMPPRAWRGRDGQVIAEGRLTDIRNRRLTITNASGEAVRVAMGELSDDDWCFLAASWNVPTECALGDVKLQPRAWEPLTLTWKASATGNKPLYFQEVQLERYGHTAGPIFQPVLSGAHFFLNIAVLPYKMGINPPNECRYALGYYRPGNCAPWLVPPVPISLRGGLLQAGAVVGGVALFP